MPRQSKGWVRDHGDRKRAFIKIKGQTYSMVCDTEAEAWGAIRGFQERYGGKRRPPLTLGAWGARWLDEVELQRRYKEIGRMRSRWRSHVADTPLTDKPLRALTRADLHDFCVELLEKEATKPAPGGVRVGTGEPLSRPTVVHVLKLLRGMLDDAANRGHVKTNVAAGLRVPKTPHRPRLKKWTYLEPAEIDAVLAVDHGRYTAERRALYATAIYAGLRLGELLNLQWQHVVLDGARPRLIVEGDVKSETSMREVPLLPPAIQALRAWRNAGGVRKARGHVWPGRDGGRRKTTHVWWTTKHQTGSPSKPGTKERAGITRRVRFHDLRHTFCSHLVMGTWGRAWSLLEVKEMAGHSEIGVTQRYAHLSPEGVAARMADVRRAWSEER